MFQKHTLRFRRSSVNFLHHNMYETSRNKRCLDNVPAFGAGWSTLSNICVSFADHVGASRRQPEIGRATSARSGGCVLARNGTSIHVVARFRINGLLGSVTAVPQIYRPPNMLMSTSPPPPRRLKCVDLVTTMRPECGCFSNRMRKTKLV